MTLLRRLLDSIHSRLKRGDCLFEGAKSPIELGLGETNHRPRLVEFSLHVRIEPVDARAQSHHALGDELSLVPRAFRDDVGVLACLNSGEVHALLGRTCRGFDLLASRTRRRVDVFARLARRIADQLSQLIVSHTEIIPRHQPT